MEDKIHRLQKYKYVEPKYILDPYNLGMLKSSTLDNKRIEQWVKKQRNYIQNLSLEEKSALILYLKHPELYNISLSFEAAISKVLSSTFHQLHPDEDLPNKDTLERYHSLVYKLVRESPITPFSTLIYVTETP